MSPIDTIVKASDSLYESITSTFSDASSKSYKVIVKDGEDQVTKNFTLKLLDDWKCFLLPQIVSERYDKYKETWITKQQLISLMDWKLAKGKYRPILPKLIQSNEAATVETVSKSAFAVLTEYFSKSSSTKPDFWKKNKDTYIDVIKKALKIICELRGVGPATGSLILSLLHQINSQLSPPFFSDESFLYFVVDCQRPGTKIKYNVKEYTDELLPEYLKIVSTQNVAFNTLERGAWALKSYHENKSTSLVNVKPDFEIEDEYKASFKALDEHIPEDNSSEEHDDEPARKKRKPKK